MKKIIIFSIIIIAIGYLSSCNNKKEEPKTDNQEQIATQEQQTPDKTQIEKNETEESKDSEVETQLGEAPQKEIEEQKSQPTDFSKTPLKCKIIALDDIATGNFKKITKPLAQEFINKGKILVVKDDYDRIFFIYNEDGSFASKKLAKYAANEYIGIIGKYKNINDINIIIATMIESMD